MHINNESQNIKKEFDSLGLGDSVSMSGNNGGSGSSGHNKPTSNHSNKNNTEKVEKVKTELNIDPNSLDGLKNQYNEVMKAITSTDWTERGQEQLNLMLKYSETLKSKIESKEIELNIKPKIEEGSENALERDINKVTSELKNINPKLNPEKFNEVKEKLKSLLDLKEELDKELSFDIKPTIFVPETKLQKGNIEDKRQSYQNAMSLLNQAESDYGNKIINKEVAERQVKDIINQLQEIIPELEIQVKVNDDGTFTTIKGNVDTLQTSLGNMGSAIQGVGSAMQNLSKDNEELSKVAAVTTAIGQIVLSFAQAMSQAASQGPWAWIAAGIAGTATLASMIAQMQSFADGGIVKGSSYSGDATYIKANAGELILNRSQQTNLYNAIKSNNLGGNGSIGGNVTFEISGQNLKGVLNNYNRKSNKQS